MLSVCIECVWMVLEFVEPIVSLVFGKIEQGRLAPTLLLQTKMSVCAIGGIVIKSII